MNQQKLQRFLLISVFLIILLFTGCGQEKEDETKIKDMDFTVVPEADIPENLKTIIKGREANAFELTYATEDALYIVVGYGEQKTSGYSIQILSFYQTAGNLVLDTELLGPSEQDMVSQTPTYPYIVIKTEYIDLPVSFE